MCRVRLTQRTSRRSERPPGNSASKAANAARRTCAGRRKSCVCVCVCQRVCVRVCVPTRLCPPWEVKHMQVGSHVQMCTFTVCWAAKQLLGRWGVRRLRSAAAVAVTTALLPSPRPLTLPGSPCRLSPNGRLAAASPIWLSLGWYLQQPPLPPSLPGSPQLPSPRPRSHLWRRIPRPAARGQRIQLVLRGSGGKWGLHS